jgi:hypothetical protein
VSSNGPKLEVVSVAGVEVAAGVEAATCGDGVVDGKVGGENDDK